jgi:methionyl-tRNA formyltransferase
MNIAYFGSPTISSRLLKLLLDDDKTSQDIKLVFTQPDRPAGKKLELCSTPVKLIAQEKNIPIFDKRIRGNEDEVREMMLSHQIDLGIVFAYGEIISKNILSLPSKGYFNVHPSNLPKYRGPSPLAYTCILGDEEMAVSIMSLSEKMDEGPVIMKERISLNPTVTRIQL